MASRIEREGGKSFEFWTDAATVFEVHDGVCMCTVECGPNTVIVRCRTETLFASIAGAVGAIAAIPAALDNVVALQQPARLIVRGECI